MDYSSPVIEALAHYVRGAATLFFILWALRILPFVHTNRMVHRLYWCTLFMAFNYSADAVLMICFTESSTWADVVMRLADAMSVPLVCAYSLEMLRFLGVRNCQLGACHHGRVPSGGLCRTLCRFLSRIDLCSGLVAQMCYVCCSGCRNRCERSRSCAVGGHFHVNRSCGVWILVACMAYIFITFFYTLAFGWIRLVGEVAYDVAVVFIWSFLYVCARRYGAVANADSVRTSRSDADVQPSESAGLHAIDSSPSVAGQDVSSTVQSEEICLGEYSCQFEQKLSQVMNDGKLYLNPKLTLLDVALSIGSNRTYVSDYLNKVMHTTFYDYVNRLRVEAACDIIDAMPQAGRRNMPEVARQSGFNSLATFNRSFKAVKGMTPKKYYQQVMGAPADVGSDVGSAGGNDGM